MAQHIVNIAFDFDDEKAKKVAETTVDNEMHKIVKDICLDKIAPMEKSWYGAQPERNWNKFYLTMDKAIRGFLEENRDLIIEQASDKLVESVKRTKVWKDKYQITLKDDEE